MSNNPILEEPYTLLLTRIFAILLLTVHLFSSICYSLVFNFLINISDKQTVAQLDKNLYDDASLVEIAVPLNMPYLSAQPDYERVNGSIELNGVQYNYVKRKINNDTLHILCIPNQQKTQLHAAKNDYTKQLADVSPGKRANNPQTKKAAPFSEYCYHLVQYDLKMIIEATTKSFSSIQYFIPTGYTATQIKPPQVVA